MKWSTLFLFVCLPLALKAGAPRDTVVELPQVDVSSTRLFARETAGMKHTQVDSLVLIQKMGLTLSELLSENTPVFIKSEGRGALATASFRGTAPSHTRVTWNGIAINSPMLGMVDFSLIPVFIIDDITLSHGTASVAEGSGGLGGSINISNRANWNNTFTAQYMQGIGSYSTFDQNLMAGAGNQKIQWRGRAYHNSSANDYTFVNRGKPDINDGVITFPVDTNNGAYQRYGMLQELYFQPARGHMLSARWWGQQSQRSIPKVISFEGPVNADINQHFQTDHRVVADWNYYSGKWRSLIRSAYTHQSMDYIVKNQTGGKGLVPSVYSESLLKSFLNHAAYLYEHTPNLSWEIKFDLNNHWVQTADTVSKTGYDRHRAEYSGLLATRYSRQEKLNLNLLIRQEVVDNRLSPLIPFLGFDYRLSQRHQLIIKGNIARNFHHPTLNDLYWQPGGNPDLMPEKGVSMEMGIQKHTSLKNMTLQTELTAYRADVTNWIIWIPGFKGYWEPRNIKRVLSRGIEANASMQTGIGNITIKSQAAYALTRSVNHGDPSVWGDESIGKQLVYIPVHSGNVFFLAAWKGYSLAWQHNSYSQRYTTTSNQINRRDWLYPYFMNDLSLARDFLWNQWRFSAEVKVYNLFDETYRSVLHRPMPGRNYMFTLKARVN